jgi:hypothetical protein
MNKEPSPEVRAVIAAAVYVAIGSNARIASVEKSQPVAAAPINPQMNAWSLEGRRMIHSGHSLR